MSAEDLMRKAREVAREEGWTIEERNGRTILVAENPDTGAPLLIDLAVVIEALHSVMRKGIVS
jgi:TATA-binding protein-associated factor Taf7